RWGGGNETYSAPGGAPAPDLPGAAARGPVRSEHPRAPDRHRMFEAYAGGGPVPQATPWDQPLPRRTSQSPSVHEQGTVGVCASPVSIFLAIWGVILKGRRRSEKPSAPNHHAI